MVRAVVVFVLLAAAAPVGIGMPSAAGRDAVVPEAASIVMAPELSWVPEMPGEGHLFTVRLTASAHSPVMDAGGEIAGEELHFRRVDDRTLESLAAVPVGADVSVEGTVRVAYESGGEEALQVHISVTPGTYRHERLTVAPRFGSPLSPEDERRLDGDRVKAASVARAAHRTPRLWTDEIRVPRSTRVTSGFGDGREFNGQVTSRHLGLDLQGVRGDTVVAMDRGVVALVEPFLLAGNIVYLNHGAGLLSAYFHLSEQLVQVGDTVVAGTPIGRVGATGRVTGPHLHWVVRYGNTSVDPRSALEVLGSRRALQR